MRRILFAVVLASLSTSTYASGFKLSSPEIKANSTIPKRFELMVLAVQVKTNRPLSNGAEPPKIPRVLP